MKVLFLDIDGVVNSEQWYETRTKLPPTASREEWKANEFNPELCALVQRIIKETGATVVLSSSWRGHEDNHNDIRKHVCEFTEITPRLPRPNDTSWEYRERGREVNAWLMEHTEVTKYAILDDDGDFFDWQPLFQTSWKTGITVEIADRVIAYLSE